MKITKLKQRLQKDRPMTSIELRLPEDVVEDLKQVAAVREFLDYRALMQAYIGQGLRVDLEQLEGRLQMAELVASLKRQGVTDEAISLAMAEIK
jgi:hypothetical protein